MTSVLKSLSVVSVPLPTGADARVALIGYIYQTTSSDRKECIGWDISRREVLYFVAKDAMAVEVITPNDDNVLLFGTVIGIRSLFLQGAVDLRDASADPVGYSFDNLSRVSCNIIAITQNLPALVYSTGDGFIRDPRGSKTDGKKKKTNEPKSILKLTKTAATKKLTVLPNAVGGAHAGDGDAFSTPVNQAPASSPATPKSGKAKARPNRPTPKKKRWEKKNKGGASTPSSDATKQAIQATNNAMSQRIVDHRTKDEKPVMTSSAGNTVGGSPPPESREATANLRAKTLEAAAPAPIVRDPIVYFDAQSQPDVLVEKATTSPPVPTVEKKEDGAPTGPYTGEGSVSVVIGGKTISMPARDAFELVSTGQINVTDILKTQSSKPPDESADTEKGISSGYL